MLDVAAASFQTNGYASTSMQDIVREAGITGGALYHHFSTKKQLALAVIGERVSAEVGDTWVAAVRSAPTAAAGIISVFDGVAAALADQQAVSGCPLGNLASELSFGDADIRNAIVGEYAAWRSAIAERLDDDSRLGRATFACGDHTGFATMVVALFSGAMGLAKAEQRPDALRDCVRQLQRIMASDLKDRGTADRN